MLADNCYILQGFCRFGSVGGLICLNKGTKTHFVSPIVYSLIFMSQQTKNQEYAAYVNITLNYLVS